jgi:hypothetical protein
MLKFLYFNFFLDSFCITFLSDGIAAITIIITSILLLSLLAIALWPVKVDGN